MDSQPPALAHLAERQAGVFSRAQASDAGVTDRVLARRLDTGRWQRIHPGVYALFTGPLPQRSLWWAALLACGQTVDGPPTALLSHGTAALTYGMRTPTAGQLHLTVAVSRDPRRSSPFEVHRTRADLRSLATTRRGWPVTKVERTVVDLLARARTPDDVVAVLAQAVQTGRTTTDRLRAAYVDSSHSPNRAMALDLLTVVAAGAQSPLEARYLHRVERAHGLPRGERQVADDGVRRDVLYRAHATVVELDGRLDHEGVGRLRDLARDNRAAARGLVTLRLGWGDVVGARAR